jgi:LPXTG-motif cell wall-anchored protein
VREVNAHAYDDEYDADCNECGAVRDVPERPGENTPPSTGDNAMVSVGILVAAAALSILIFTLVRKKRTEA